VPIVRAAGKAIDWLGLRLILLLAIGLAGYAVLQPLIWSEVLHRKLPATSTDLASLMGIVVTIMSLVLAASGVVVYQLVERRSEAKLEERAGQLQETLEAKLEERARELLETFEARAAEANIELETVIHVRTAGIFGRVFTKISYQAFVTYEGPWREENYSLAYLGDNQELRAFLESAIDNAKYAYDVFQKLPERLRADRSNARWIMLYKSNYAYFLATRAHQDDKEHVLKMAKELDKPQIDVHKLETVAWAYLRYSKPGQPLWDMGLSRLASLMSRNDLKPDAKDILYRRYKGVMVKDGNVLDGINDALNGRYQPTAAQPPGS
jgi:nucleotide-binding universal stress UspA family protein